MLLMVEKGIQGRICHTIHWYTKANNRYMKDYDKNKNHILNNFNGWAIPKASSKQIWMDQKYLSI